MADALTEFGASGGFDRILGRMREAREGKATVRLEHLVPLAAFLAKSEPLWHRQFATKFVEQFTEEILESLCYINKEANDQNKNQVVLGPL
jgi:hypothetical protein